MTMELHYLAELEMSFGVYPSEDAGTDLGRPPGWLGSMKPEASILLLECWLLMFLPKLVWCLLEHKLMSSLGRDFLQYPI